MATVFYFRCHSTLTGSPLVCKFGEQNKANKQTNTGTSPATLLTGFTTQYLFIVFENSKLYKQYYEQ